MGRGVEQTLLGSVNRRGQGSKAATFSRSESMASSGIDQALLNLQAPDWKGQEALFDLDLYEIDFQKSVILGALDIRSRPRAGGGLMARRKSIRRQRSQYPLFISPLSRRVPGYHGRELKNFFRLQIEDPFAKDPLRRSLVTVDFDTAKEARAYAKERGPQIVAQHESAIVRSVELQEKTQDFAKELKKEGFPLDKIRFVLDNTNSRSETSLEHVLSNITSLAEEGPLQGPFASAFAYEDFNNGRRDYQIGNFDIQELSAGRKALFWSVYHPLGMHTREPAPGRMASVDNPWIFLSQEHVATISSSGQLEGHHSQALSTEEDRPLARETLIKKIVS